MRFIICAFLAFITLGTLCQTEWVCEQGIPYKENECNECTCNEHGQLKCEDKEGCLDPIESILFNCEIGTSSKRDCNKCNCLKDVGTVCTNHKCD